MKKYLGILLTLAMASCGDTGGGNGGGNGGGGVAVAKEFIGITRSTPPNNFSNPMGENAPGAISDSYRIPAALVTESGRILLTSDARYGGNGDSAANIDSAYRYSDDNGKTWSPMNFLQHFDDFADLNLPDSGGSPQTFMSASFIDPGMVQAPNGDIIVLTTTFPWRGGLFNNGDGQTKVNKLNPYTKTGADSFLRLRHKDNTGDRTVLTTYEYQVKVSGTWAPGELRAVTKVDGSTPEAGKEFKIDKHYDVYNMNGSRVMIQQYNKGNSISALELNGSVKIEANLLYYGSPYHVSTRNFLFMTKSTDNGTTFGQPYDISWHVYDETIMTSREHYFAGVSPGVGFKDSKGRILFALQQVPTKNGNGGNNCQAISMYSDDSGDTWKIGENSINLAPQGQGAINRFSESQYLATPDPDQLILMGRSKSHKVMFAVSIDRGLTWSDPTNTGLINCWSIGSMVGAANLHQTTYFGKAMVAITHVGNPSGAGDKTQRKHGLMSLGYLEDTATYKGEKVWVPVFPGQTAPNGSDTLSDGDLNFWTRANNANKEETYGYSMPVELPNGNIGWFYEGPDYQGGRPDPGSISWQEVILNRGAETTPIIPKP